MIAAAANNRWHIPVEIREKCWVYIAKILQSENATPRNQLSAIRTLALLDRLNQQDDPVQVDHTVAITTPVNEVVAEMMRQDPAYLEFQRQQAIAEIPTGPADEGNHVSP